MAGGIYLLLLIHLKHARISIVRLCANYKSANFTKKVYLFSSLYLTSFLTTDVLT